MLLDILTMMVKKNKCVWKLLFSSLEKRIQDGFKQDGKDLSPFPLLFYIGFFLAPKYILNRYLHVVKQCHYSVLKISQL